MEILHRIPSFLRLHEKEACETLVQNLWNEVEKAGFKKAVVGLSGGIDSSLSLYLSVKALGKENVLGVRMPYRTSSPKSLEHAQLVIDDTGIQSSTIDISPQVDAYFTNFPDSSLLRRGNKMARERMSILYDLSSDFEGLVIGTGNRSEILLGYGTQYGDVACAINPLGKLYKSQVYLLANYLGIPSSILAKPPSADLWENQTDEKELGFTYLEVDQLLYYMVDKQSTKTELKELSFSSDMIKNVENRIERNKFKRRMPTILSIK